MVLQCRRRARFLQFFWDPNRMCARMLAETIVVDVRKYRSVIHSHKKDVPALNRCSKPGQSCLRKMPIGQLVLKIV